MKKLGDLFITIDPVLSDLTAMPKKYFSKDELKQIGYFKDALSRDLPFKPKWPLLNKLYNAVLFLKFKRSKYSPYQIKVLRLYKLISIAKILLALHSRNSAIHLLENIYRQSKEISFHDGIYQSSRPLMLHYSQYESNIKKSKFYFEECDFAMSCLKNEFLAEWYLSDIVYNFKRKKNHNESTLIKSKNYIDVLSKMPNKHKSSRFMKLYLSIGTIFYDSTFQYESLCAFLEENINQIKHSNQYSQEHLKTTKLHLGNYYIRLNKLESSKKVLKSLENSLMKNTSHWFFMKELYSIYYLRTGDKLIALEILNEIRNNKYYRLINLDDRNRIDLVYYYALIYYVLDLPDKEAVNLIKKSKFQKFLNSIPEFNADKSAMNVAIIIVQLLYLIVLRDYDRVLEKKEAVMKYMSRYMKKDPLFRSHTFIKMLLEVQKQNFHPKAIERHTIRYENALNDVPFLKSKHPVEIEIIEYENLWRDLIIHLL